MKALILIMCAGMLSGCATKSFVRDEVRLQGYGQSAKITSYVRESNRNRTRYISNLEDRVEELEAEVYPKQKTETRYYRWVKGEGYVVVKTLKDGE